jgi:hypothetical protein
MCALTADRVAHVGQAPSPSALCDTRAKYSGVNRRCTDRKLIEMHIHDLDHFRFAAANMQAHATNDDGQAGSRDFNRRRLGRGSEDVGYRGTAAPPSFRALQGDQVRKMKELERENARLQRLVAGLSAEKQVLADVAAGSL